MLPVRQPTPAQKRVLEGLRAKNDWAGALLYCLYRGGPRDVLKQIEGKDVWIRVDQDQPHYQLEKPRWIIEAKKAGRKKWPRERASANAFSPTGHPPTRP